MLGRGPVLFLFALGLSGCAPWVWSARAPSSPDPSRIRAERLRIEAEGPSLVPPAGVIFHLEPEVETSTEGLASEPLESPWLASEEPVAPVLAQTGTITFDLPWSDDPSVEAWRALLEARGRRYFETWLARSTRYVPLFWKVLDEHQLPRDLVFLAMVESGLSPRALSWAAAAGPWQFMPVTARRYGLRVGFWVDERRDFEKSTEAAARHLAWLHSVFEDWHLAMAAYNAGAGRVRGALEKSGRRDFWSLRRTRRIRRETKEYVPKILATAAIAKAPERYGFTDVPYQPPIAWETVTVTVSTSLSTVGEACGGLPGDALEELNPALRVGVTPPGETWLVRVPPGFAEACADGLASLPRETRETFRYHEAAVGEPLEAIARAHGTTPEAILRFHEQTDPERMLDYAELAVPIPYAENDARPIRRPPDRDRGRYAPGDAQLVRYRVRSGDSLWKVARRFGVSMAKLRSWNGLWRSPTLQIGQRLKVYVGRGAGRGRDRRPPPSVARAKTTAQPGRHRVREGESLWLIARRYDTTVERIRALNGLAPGQILAIGQELRVR